jgi:hypothetical protein
MKLSKEEIQKVVLSGIMLVVLLYAYFAMLLGPLKRAAVSIQGEIDKVQPQIDAANKQIRTTRALEDGAAEVRETVERIKSIIPLGSPIAWFPPRVVEIVERVGVKKVVVRPAGNGGLEAPESFRSLKWSIDLPEIGFAQLGSSVAELENREPLLRIERMEIDASANLVEKQHARLTAANIVRNEE